MRAHYILKQLHSPQADEGVTTVAGGWHVCMAKSMAEQREARVTTFLGSILPPR